MHVLRLGAAPRVPAAEATIPLPSSPSLLRPQVFTLLITKWRRVLEPRTPVHSPAPAGRRPHRSLSIISHRPHLPGCLPSRIRHIRRISFRQDMNRMEAKGSSRAVDSLLNYETVKYFNNEEHEARKPARLPLALPDHPRCAAYLQAGRAAAWRERPLRGGAGAGRG